MAIITTVSSQGLDNVSDQSDRTMVEVMFTSATCDHAISRKR